jgi:hypothetical protein
MRWYLNDASVQAQFMAPADFLVVLRGLMALRQQYEALRSTLYVTTTFPQRPVQAGLSIVQLLGQPEHREIQSLVLRWLGRGGPFIEDDRWPEADDYFEFENRDVTESGLGEAARRIKAQEDAATFSFSGGEVDFARSPLVVFHGLQEERYGQYEVANLWSVARLQETLAEAVPLPRNWRELVESARSRFPNLWLPDEIYLNNTLAREPFDSVIRDRTLVLLAILNQYMGAREGSAESPAARKIIEDHFTGTRAAFSGESATNQRDHEKELTFPDPAAPHQTIFAHWHGKISHRAFRLHFEWPVPATANQLKVVYLGPKITKT